MSFSKPVGVLARDLGGALARYRLARNLRQSDIASLSGISRGAVARLEAGEGGTIDSLLRVLQALDIDERAMMLVPEATLSPLDPRSQIAPRQRARNLRDETSTEEPWSWGE